MDTVCCIDFQFNLLELLDDPENSNLAKMAREDRFAFGAHIDGCVDCQKFFDHDIQLDDSDLHKASLFFLYFFAMWKETCPPDDVFP